MVVTHKGFHHSFSPVWYNTLSSMEKERAPSPARQLPTSGFEIVEDEMLLEEQSFSWYTPETFCPVKIGDILQSKYQVLGKLGYGSVSTAWLCRDLVLVLLYASF